MLLLDMETHRPVDVFDGRTADSFAAWLREHPGVEIICRDRGGNYAEGARSGAPDAVQVADRFHLWANLGEAVEKTVLAHRSCLPGPVPTDQETTPTASVLPDQVRDVDGDERRLTVRKRERYAAVQALMVAGHSLNSISRQTGFASARSSATPKLTAWRTCWPPPSGPAHSTGSRSTSSLGGMTAASTPAVCTVNCRAWDGAAVRERSSATRSTFAG